jgi:hypothetical protein
VVKSSVLTPEIIDEILGLVADGKGMRTICKDPALPSRETWRTAVELDPALKARYESARLEAGETFAEEVVNIADTEKDPQKAKNRIDARKWAAKFLNPARYGDRQRIDVTNSPADMSDSALTAEVAAILGVNRAVEPEPE